MKTTIEIADPVLRRAKELAAARGTTLREIVEMALRQMLGREEGQRRDFRLRKRSFRGRGLRRGVRSGDWSRIRSMIYEGRGG